MAIFTKKPPEVLPGVNPEEDCRPADMPPALTPPEPGDGWAFGRPQRTALERWLERAALTVEAPFQRWIAAPQLNPLYYTGTLAVLLLGIVAATGVYLFFFYGYGIQESYRSVSIVEGLLTGRTVRAVHRYASGALLITSLLHAFRLYFQGRSRGARWLAWVSGVVMMLVIGLAGITGYWLVLDQRAQLITDAVFNLATALTPYGEALANGLVRLQERGQSWLVVAGVFVVHFALFLALAGFLWVHVLRLSRPKLLPAIYWLAASGALLIAAGLVWPAGLLPPFDAARQPGLVNLDPLYLFWLPPSLSSQPVWIWVVVGLVVAVGAAIPWLPAGQAPPRVVVDAARCTGCTKCALDCPYKALRMETRSDGRRHKYVAVADPQRCVACGLCLGSCDVLALALGPQLPEALPNQVRARLEAARRQAPGEPVKVVFTCERHAAQGARPYLDQLRVEAGQRVAVIPVPCVGALHPNLVTQTVEWGAAAVQVVGCPPEDCAQREGNVWAHSRLTRQRLPRLKRAFLDAPISTTWTQPLAFAAALRAPAQPLGGDLPWAASAEPDHRPRGVMIFQSLGWRHYLVAFGLLGVVLGAQTFATRLPLQPAAAASPQAEIAVADLSTEVVVPTTDDPLRLTLEVDGAVVWERAFQPCDLAVKKASPVFVRVPLTAGRQTLRLRLTTSDGRYALVLHTATVDVQPGQIVPLRPDHQPATGLAQ